MKLFVWKGRGNYEGWSFTALATDTEHARQVILAAITNPNIELYARNLLENEPAEYDEPVALIEDKGIVVLA